MLMMEVQVLLVVCAFFIVQCQRTVFHVENVAMFGAPLTNVETHLKKKPGLSFFRFPSQQSR